LSFMAATGSIEFIKNLLIEIRIMKEQMKTKLIIPVIFILFYSFTGCNRENNPKENDTPTTGEITICADETFAPIVDSEVTSFNKIYTYAKINVLYKSETQAINDLLSDSARLVIVTRKLTKEENSIFEKQNIIPIVRKICYDAVAVILNNQNKDTLLTMQNFRDIMSGNIANWWQLNKKSELSAIQIVFDNPNSSTVRFVKEKINNAPLAKNSYAVENNSAVVDYVSKNKNAIGIIGVNWISDKYDTLTHNFLQKVKVAGISDTIRHSDAEHISYKKDGSQIRKESSWRQSFNDYYQPYQAYIAQKTYPLIREVYILSGEARTGLGSGFIAFVTSDKGQRIVLKGGLVPATAPVRLVEIRNENINITK